MNRSPDVSEIPHGVPLVAGLLDVHLDCSTRRIRAGGELDYASSNLLARAMAELIDTASGDSSVDIGDVTFLDASGLGCLVHFANQLAAVGAKLSVVGATTRQRWLFERVGLRALLETSDLPPGGYRLLRAARGPAVLPDSETGP
jgi:anti-anti-sigma factor